MGLFSGKTYHLRSAGTTNLVKDNYDSLVASSIINKVSNNTDSAGYLNILNAGAKDVFNKYYHIGKIFVDKYAKISYVNSVAYDNDKLVARIKALSGLNPDVNNKGILTYSSIKNDTYVNNEHYVKYCLEDLFNHVSNNYFLAYYNKYFSNFKCSISNNLIEVNGYWYIGNDIVTHGVAIDKTTYEATDIEENDGFIQETNDEGNLTGKYVVDTTKFNSSYSYIDENAIKCIFTPIKSVTRKDEITTLTVVSNKVKTITTTTVSTYTGTYTENDDTSDSDDTTYDVTLKLKVTTNTTTETSVTTEADNTTSSITEQTVNLESASDEVSLFIPANTFTDQEWRSKTASKFYYDTMYLSDFDADTYFNSNFPVSGLSRYLIVYFKCNDDLKVVIIDLQNEERDLFSYNIVNMFSSYPIVTLRENFYNLCDYYGDSIEVSNEEYSGTVNKPAWITKERYDLSKRVLNALSMDIDTLSDGYSKDSEDKTKDNESMNNVRGVSFLLGIVPNRRPYDDDDDTTNNDDNDNEIVSKYLYYMFEALTNGTVQGTENAFCINQSPYYLNIQYTPYWDIIYSPATDDSPVNSYNSYIKNTHTNSESGYDDGAYYIEATDEWCLVITKQISKTEKKEYKIYTYARGEGYNFDSDIKLTISYNYDWKYFVDLEGWSDKNLVLPLLPTVVKKLTPLDCIRLTGYCFKMQFVSYKSKHVGWFAVWGSGLIQFIGIVAIVMGGAFMMAAAATAAGSGTAAGAGALSKFTLAGAIGMKAGASAAFVNMLGTVAMGAISSSIMNAVAGNTALTVITSIAMAAISFVTGGGLEGFGANADTIFKLTLSAGEVYNTATNAITEQEIQKIQKQNASMQSEYSSRMNSIQETLNSLDQGALNPEFFADLYNAEAISENNDTTKVGSTLFKPSALIYLTLYAHRDKDVLFKNSVLDERDNTTVLTIGD